MSDIPNKNFLSPTGFKFDIKKLPNLSYFVQKVNIPGLTLGQADVSTPLVKLPVPGDHIGYDFLNVTFKVDEDMNNYNELYDWIVALGYPDNFDQAKGAWTRGTFIQKASDEMNSKGVYSTAQLIILTNSMNYNLSVDFNDVYPLKLSELMFDATVPDINFVTASAVFVYRSFKISRGNG